MESLPYTLQPPAGTRSLPIVVSCPHSGTEIPTDLRRGMTAAALAMPDTDWFVHELYGFAPALGITLIQARYSRYVVDLNRDPVGAKLYEDGRSETAMVPVRTFAGEAIYSGTPPDASEIERRRAAYFAPYHAAVAAQLAELRARHRHVLLFDAHSIKRRVPSIRPLPFADVILGDCVGSTAFARLSEVAMAALRGLELAHNQPFKGGYLTRRFGRPDQGIHALQLEMSQDIYMDEATAARDGAKQARIQGVLAPLLLSLATTLAELP